MPEHRPEPSSALRHVRWLARLLDESIPIPGTSYRIGIDAIVGLVPGIGDMIGGALSTYIVVRAMLLGAPRPTVVRMVVNVLIEVVVGALPLVGDLFDAAWKANMRNARLLEAALVNAPRRARVDRVFVTAVAAGLLLTTAGVAWLSWRLFALLLGIH